jgi:c(7)-type cytochrome triheme protein
VRETGAPRTGRSPAHDPRPCAAWALLALLVAGNALGASATGDSSRAAPAIELRLPPDIVYARADRADSAVTFSHRTHVMFAANRCTGCHPGAFPMLKRGPMPSHRGMNAGGSCGLCHDGRQAFGVTDSLGCRTCHSGPRQAQAAAAAPTRSDGAAAAAPRLPKPHTYPRSEDSPGSATFRHKSHTQGADGCAACHPKLFRMTAAPPLEDFGMHERGACGACHDGARAFATDDPETCARCHRESGAAP